MAGWIVPSAPDGSTVQLIDQDMVISWNESDLSSEIFKTLFDNDPTANLEEVDLWMVASDAPQIQFPLMKNFYGSSEWVISKYYFPYLRLNASEIDYWEFNFVRGDDWPGGAINTVRSPRFYLLDSISSSTTSSSMTISTMVTSEGSLTSPTTGPSSLPANNTPQPLSPGAMAGVIIGAVLGALALLVAGCFLGLMFLARRNRSNESHHGQNPTSPPPQPPMVGIWKGRTTAHTSTAPLKLQNPEAQQAPAELPDRCIR